MNTFNDENNQHLYNNKLPLTGASHSASVDRGYFSSSPELHFRNRKEKIRKKSLRDHRREGRRREW